MKWISKNTKKPEHGDKIDIFLEDERRICNCIFHDSDHNFIPYVTSEDTMFSFKWTKVTHWMPIPNIPI